MTFNNTINYINFKHWFDDSYITKNITKQILVVDRNTYANICDFITNNLSKDEVNDNFAFISIAASDSCSIGLWDSLEQTSHHLDENIGINVCNVNFDDVTEDEIFTNERGIEYSASAISIQDAKKIVAFVKDNIGKHFIIHCKAGKSRSQAVAKFITDNFNDTYQFNLYNLANPCNTPNIKVKSLLTNILSFPSYFE